ncbi:patatin-like phospholipase family protein [Candidatus Odyssella acanthamoebae]|uniref:patatin-like phospholipase family protein n=1 Tax=Candidatus Odyssella acanthamoebae TaxID=91604 RepID=UPI000A032B81|nr:patatin-like phospholipase family protein [Candidatus Paracaedibacter acanthamoebae]
MLRRNRLLVTLLSLALTACTQLKFADSPHPYDPQLPIYQDIDIAFVLGGGGAKGLAHVGIMEELMKEGIYPDLIVGCSAGSIVGALYADSLDINQVKALLLPQVRENLVNISLNFLPFGISDGNGLQSFLTEALKARYFEELKIPFVAVATNLQFGDMTALGRGKLIPAVKASSAFPGIFTPVEVQGQFFVDGGVSNNAPAEIAHRMGAKFIIAIELDAGLPDTAPSHALGILRRCLQISLRHQSRLALVNADYVLKVSLPMMGTFDNGMNEVVYQRGLEVGRNEAPKIRQLIEQKLGKQTGVH